MLTVLLYKEKQLELLLEQLMCHHPLAAFFVTFFGMPALLLLAVFACAIIAIVPMGLLFGWL